MRNRARKSWPFFGGISNGHPLHPLGATGNSATTGASYSFCPQNAPTQAYGQIENDTSASTTNATTVFQLLVDVLCLYRNVTMMDITIIKREMVCVKRAVLENPQQPARALCTDTTDLHSLFLHHGRIVVVILRRRRHWLGATRHGFRLRHGSRCGGFTGWRSGNYRRCHARSGRHAFFGRTGCHVRSFAIFFHGSKEFRHQDLMRQTFLVDTNANINNGLEAGEPREKW